MAAYVFMSDLKFGSEGFVLTGVAATSRFTYGSLMISVQNES